MEERATSPAGQRRFAKASPASASRPRAVDLTIQDFRPPQQPSQPGRRLVAGYELLEELGQGGMGVVYLARQVHLGRLVALKMIRSPLANREELVRFRTEAEAVARLAHPNIVQIHEIGEQEGTPFFSLELCAGGPLDGQLKGRPLPPRQAARLLETLARAVQHAHEHGIVHRDLKPANVLLAFGGDAESAERRASQGIYGIDGSHGTHGTQATHESPKSHNSLRATSVCGLRESIPKIADFGLAKRLDHPDGMTRVGAIVGTPPYMAPEQAAGQNELIGPATDIWALGAILYECLSGSAPFQSESALETLEHIRRQEPISPRVLNLAVPRDLETICLRCLHKDPSRRYPSAQALADDLKRWLSGEPIVARPAGRLERFAKWARRRPAVAALLLVSSLLIGVLLAAAPLHIVRLRAKVKEARDAAVSAHLHAECAHRLAEGREALARGGSVDVQTADVFVSTVIEDLDNEDARADEALAALRDKAYALKRQIAERTSRQASQAREHDRARKFLALRDEAFFELYHDEVAGLAASSARRSRDLARQAIGTFPDTSSLPINEAKELHRARREVLFLLAEGTARCGGPAAWQEALNLLDQAGSDGSVPFSLSRRRARYLTLLGRREEAARQHERAKQAQPVGALDWFLAGLDHWQAGNARDALKELNRAVEIETDSFWPQFFRGLALHQLGEAAEARAALHDCRRLRPDFSWPYLVLGYFHIDEGKLDAAAADLDRAGGCVLDQLARYALLVNRGVLAVKRKQSDLAMEQFQRAALLMPDCQQAHAHLAGVYRQRGKRRRALEELDRAVSLAPELAELYRVRAALHRECGRSELALRDLDSAIRLTPVERAPSKLPLDYRERAHILYDGKRFADALAACGEALRFSSEDPAAIRLRGESLLELGRPREALDAYDRYLKKCKPDVELYRRRARARASLGDLSGVVDEYSAALSLRRDAPLLTAHGWALLMSAAPRPALRDFKAALALKPNDADALAGRGAASVELGDWRVGIADAEEALRRDPRSARHLYNVARVLARAATVSPADLQSAARSARAIVVLGDAIERIPAPERKRFWNDQVRRDSAFRPLARNTRFVELDRRYAGSPPARRDGTAP